jgi:hypothetical protein
MATSGTHGLQRQSLSSERARRTIEAIETVVGRTISSNTSNHSSSKTALEWTQLEFDFSRSVDKANG